MIRAGIIGMGRSGWELHADPLRRMSGYSVAAVCDQSPERLAQAAGEFQAEPYSDAHKLMSEAEVDLVIVAVPGSLHSSLAIAGLQRGKHVVVEKPMANTLAEADEMLAAAQSSGRLLTVFHNRRWDRDYQLVKTLIQNGQLGDVLTVDSRVMTYGTEWCTYGVPEFNPAWRVQAAYGGGFLSDWGPHLAEQCLDLIGQWPASVSCELRSDLWATEVEDYFHVRLMFPSGVSVTMEGSNNARLPLPRWFVVGREGTLIADGAWGRWTEMRLRRSLDDVTVDLMPQDVGASSGSRDYDVGEELSACFYGDLEEALAQNRPAAITAERGRDVVAILDAARRSHEIGQTVVPSAPKGAYASTASR